MEFHVMRSTTAGYLVFAASDGAVVEMPMSVVCESSAGMPADVWSKRSPRLSVRRSFTVQLSCAYPPFWRMRPPVTAGDL